MKASQFFRSAPALLLAVTLSAQPSFEGPAPVVTSVPAEDQRLAAYHARVDEVLQWRAGRVDLNDIPGTMDMASISILLTLGR
ncbi:MAG TPA: hypothetical protein PLF88_09530, partial [Opitutaceae bacterium]|nr:hypothetical protein [Opitutaceae bacterium]